jgi:hypothetical protein
MNFPVLLIGFIRSDLLRRRLLEILSQVSGSTTIYVYVDGPRDSRDIENNSKIRDLKLEFETYENIQFVFRDSNLGCSQNILLAVAEVCTRHSGAIVVEDDISISPDFISSVGKILELWTPDSDWLTVGGFSPFVSHNFWVVKLFSRWRKSDYFSGWGWGIRAEAWDLLASVNRPDLLKNGLSVSHQWNDFGRRKQVIWMTRLNRSVWDFQVQLSHFALEKSCLLPTFRLIDNQGFESELSTHTRHKRPWSFFGAGYSICAPETPQIHKTKKSGRIWSFLDANLWAADGHFNSRARVLGVRSFIKKLLKRDWT